MIDKIRKIKNELLIRKTMKQLDPILNDEQIEQYRKRHPGLTIDFFMKQDGLENIPFKEFPYMDRKEKRRFLVFYYAVEYYERNHQKENDSPEEKKLLLAIYQYFIARKLQEQDPV